MTKRERANKEDDDRIKDLKFDSEIESSDHNNCQNTNDHYGSSSPEVDKDNQKLTSVEAQIESLCIAGDGWSNQDDTMNLGGSFGSGTNSQDDQFGGLFGCLDDMDDHDLNHNSNFPRNKREKKILAKSHKQITREQQRKAKETREASER